MVREVLKTIRDNLLRAAHIDRYNTTSSPGIQSFYTLPVTFNYVLHDEVQNKTDAYIWQGEEIVLS